MARVVRDRQLSLRLTPTELEVFEAVRWALLCRGALRSVPSRADTVSLLAADLCYRVAQGGASPRVLRCREARAAWEREYNSPDRLRRLLGSWLWDKSWRLRTQAGRRSK